MSNGQTVGYVRVSTADQNTRASAGRIQLDKVSPITPAEGHRPAAADRMPGLRPRRDELVVHSMDRLARSLVDLRRTVERPDRARRQGAVFQGGPDLHRDTADPCAVLMLSVMGAVAESNEACCWSASARA